MKMFSRRELSGEVAAGRGGSGLGFPYVWARAALLSPRALGAGVSYKKLRLNVCNGVREVVRSRTGSSNSIFLRTGC